MFNTRSLVKETVEGHTGVSSNCQKGWRACDGVKGGFLCDMVWGRSRRPSTHTAQPMFVNILKTTHLSVNKVL